VAEIHQTKRKNDPDGRVPGSDDGPSRMCAVTRAELPPDALIRFVRAPDGEIVPDLEQRLPGRGVWLTCNRKIVEKAIKTKAFARSLQAEAHVPADLPERLEAMLVRRASDTLALANKAGLIAPGFQQVDAALEKGHVEVLLHGADAADDGRSKLDRKFRAIQREKGLEAPIIDILTIAQMSLAIGRPSVVHAALLPGGLAKRFQREAERVSRYRSTSDPLQLSGQLSGQTIHQAQDTDFDNKG
jgi:predicted RNA-binding protein YlxR (DUF448 family)